MLQTVLGAILLVFPFIYLVKYKDKSLAFVYIFSWWLGLHLFIALLTQLLHVFAYPVIMAINLIVDLALLAVLRPRKISFCNPIVFLKQNWPPILGLIIALVCLYSVHYNYSGKYSVAVDSQYQEAQNMRYPYPYFADEWYAVAFIKNSITSHSLPLLNPVTRAKLPFINFEMAFHSFLSEVFLLLHADPLAAYVNVGVIFNLILCGLIYLLLRHNHLSKIISVISALLALYITNGNNLPGLWTLIPSTLGIIAMLLGFIFLSSNKKMAGILAALLALLFYPPFFLFYSFAIVIFLLPSKNGKIKEKISDIAYYFTLCIMVALIISLAYFLPGWPAGNIFHEIFSKIFYRTLTTPYNPNFPIFTVIPCLAMALLPFGLYSLIKKQLWLALNVLLGLAFWLFYSQSTFRVFIEYERVVVLTSILIVITAGFGMDYLISQLKKITFFQNNDYLGYLQVGILSCFLLLVFNYTNRDGWKNFTANSGQAGQYLQPAAVANNYLQADDLDLFKNIHRKIFLSLPWKGTVLGVATDNYPASVKTGTIGIYPYLSNEFMAAGCGQKIQLAIQYKLDYIYLPQFSCPQFELITDSSEGLYLYRVEK